MSPAFSESKNKYYHNTAINDKRIMPLNFLDFNSSYFFKKSLGVELVSAIFFLAA